MSYEFAPKFHDWLMRPHRKRTRARDAARVQLAQPPLVFDESTILESPTTPIEDPKELIINPPTDVTDTMLHVVSVPIVDTISSDELALVVTTPRKEIDAPLVVENALNVFSAPSPEPTVFIFSALHSVLNPTPVWMYRFPNRILPSATTSSKRGRFDSKGRRMMRFYIAICQVSASQRCPRPWRPPLITFIIYFYF